MVGGCCRRSWNSTRKEALWIQCFLGSRSLASAFAVGSQPEALSGCIVNAPCVGDCFSDVKLGYSTWNSVRVTSSIGTPASVGELHKLCKDGRLDEAIHAIELLDFQRVSISTDLLHCLLQGCAQKKDLAVARRLRNFMVSKQLDWSNSLGDQLIRLFALCGSLVEANQVFFERSKRSVHTWNAIICAHTKLGAGERAIELYHKMQEEGVEPDNFGLSCVLKACCGQGAIEQGRLIHDHIRRNKLELDLVVGNTLIHMYAKCGSLEEACKVFDELPSKDVVSWAAMIAGYARHGCGLLALELFQKMLEEGIQADKVTFLCALKACGSTGALSHGRLIHEQIVRAKLESDVMIASTVVDMYAKCGSLQEARRIFDNLINRDSVLWSAMIAGYADYGHGESALVLFEKMQQEGIKPNKFTFSCSLKACGNMGAIEHGRIIHDQINRSGFGLDVIVGNTLIDMYARCGSLEEAHKVFDKLMNRNVISWGTMIAGYAQHGHIVPALQLFEKMQQASVKPDKVIYLCILKACGSIGAIVQGRLLHDQIIRSELASEAAIGNSLVDMYANCKSLEDACKLFDKLPNRNVVSWGALIAGYAEHGHEFVALDLFEKMQDLIMPDKVTFLCVLKACGSIGAIGQGRLRHDQILKFGFELDMVIGSALVDMYSKCGWLEEACNVFDRLLNQDLVSWGAMISGFVQCGNWTLVKQSIVEMGKVGLRLNDAIFSTILVACSHTGLLEEGSRYFKCMREDHGLAPNIDHYSCMVDLLGRAGFLDAAEDLLQTMPIKSNIIAWSSLLTCCRTYSDMELGRQCFNHVTQINPTDASGYVLMSNIYSDVDRLQDVENVTELKKLAGASKKPGKSWVEIRNRVHEFVVRSENYLQNDEIHAMFKTLSKRIKKDGYVPQLDLMLGVRLNEEKEDGLCGNNERLGIGFGLAGGGGYKHQSHNEPLSMFGLA